MGESFPEPFCVNVLCTWVFTIYSLLSGESGSCVFVQLVLGTTDFELYRSL